jgi:hypothetical protein
LIDPNCIVLLLFVDSVFFVGSVFVSVLSNSKTSADRLLRNASANEYFGFDRAAIVLFAFAHGG